MEPTGQAPKVPKTKLFLLPILVISILALSGCRDVQSNDDPGFTTDVPEYCDKPVIYIYPEEKTDVELHLEFNGDLTFSYPEYTNGWKITAYPNGTLIDQQGREYNYLLRESLKGRMVKYETRFKKDGVFIGHDKNYLVPINDRNKNVFNFMQVSEDLLANSDVLTHFPTRFMFEDYFRYYTKVNGKSPVYICIVDIDNFKAINDTYGHVTGDKAIQLTAQRLTQILGREDYICRFGGDEFIVLFVNQTKEEVMTKCHKIIDLTKEQVCLEGYNINLTYSIGVASSQGERVYEKILKRADKALYEVKARGKSHILFFNELCSIR